MATEFGGAKWIGVSHAFDLHEVYLDFRSPFIVGQQGQSTELLISADSRYKLWVNGRFVGRGPSRSYPQAQSYDCYDLSEVWHSGQNLIAVQVYQPGYSHFSYVHRATAGMVATLQVNGEPELVTDSSWRARRNPSFSDQVPRVSLYGSGVEVQDLAANDDWQAVGYDDVEWEGARIIAEADGHLWQGLRLRDTPLLQERLSRPALVGVRFGTVDPSLKSPHEQLRQAWLNGKVAEVTTDADGWIRPVLNSTQTALWLYDLGRAYTCQGVIEVQAANGDEQITISYADKMNDGQLVISDPLTYCRVQMSDSFRLRAGEQIVESFAFRGGRYILIQLKGFIDPEFAMRPQVRLAEYPLEVSKPLPTGDNELDAIIAMCENTFRACLQDSFVDCVWRESSQWLGDGLIQSFTMTAMSDDLRPTRKLLFDTAVGQDHQHMVPSIAPGEVHSYTIPRYACMWVELLALYVEQSDDTTFPQDGPGSWGERVWRCFERLTDYLAAGNGELRVTPAGRRHYIDWSATSANDPHCVYNLHVVLALQRATEIAERLSIVAPEKWLNATQQLQQLCQQTFQDGGIWFDDLERTTYSQLASAMALLTGTVEESAAANLLEGIVARSLDLNDNYQPGEMVLASPFMHHYLFAALDRFGKHEAIIAIIRARWGRWVKQGQPTTWENWNVDFPDGSRCHAFSAHPRYHLMKALQSQVA